MLNQVEKDALVQFFLSIYCVPNIKAVYLDPAVQTWVWKIRRVGWPKPFRWLWWLRGHPGVKVKGQGHGKRLRSGQRSDRGQRSTQGLTPDLAIDLNVDLWSWHWPLTLTPGLSRNHHNHQDGFGHPTLLWCPYPGEEKDNHYKLDKAMALPLV